jgi:pimeloyl-ACP methyl ester carboxylesterase
MQSSKSLLLSFALLLSAPVAGRCQGEAVGSSQLWAQLAGQGAVTVVFEAGNGNDSTVWSAVTGPVQAAGARTLVYDRAGLGKSGKPPARASIESEVARLRGVMQACGVSGPVILVGASHGGSIAQLLASQSRQIKGLVLVDAVIPQIATPAWARQFRDAARKDYPEVRRELPALAAAVIPVVEAMPATARSLRANRLPPLPIIDIVADKAAVPGNDPKADADWVAGHRAFVAGHVQTEAVLANGSGHKIMVDKPDVVVAAIVRMLARIAAPSGPRVG